MAPVAVTTAPLDVEALTKQFAAHGDGAITTFTGIVRSHNQGRNVRFWSTKRTSRWPFAR
jgi:molybdopterin synthase catalytic subunit